MPTRAIRTPPRARNGLFVQPDEAGAAREVIERHNRERFASHFHYGDPEVNSRTYDERGDYNCGRCNMAEGEACLLLDIKRIDREAGSCEDWEITSAADPEMALHEKSPDEAAYGIAANGKGFGCRRCPYASPAYKSDSLGRELYCGKGDFRVYGTACCALNGAETVEASVKWQRDRAKQVAERREYR